MRQQILDALEAKFQGVSEKILGRIADKLAKTVTTAEQVATAVEGSRSSKFLTATVTAGLQKPNRQPYTITKVNTG